MVVNQLLGELVDVSSGIEDYHVRFDAQRER